MSWKQHCHFDGPFVCLWLCDNISCNVSMFKALHISHTPGYPLGPLK